MNNTPVNIPIYSGATVNVLHEQYVSPADIHTTTTVPHMYNQYVVKPLVKVKEMYKPCKWSYIYCKACGCTNTLCVDTILGSRVSQFINILTLNKNNLEPVL